MSTTNFGVMPVEKHNLYENEPWVLLWHKLRPRWGQNLEAKMNQPSFAGIPVAGLTDQWWGKQLILIVV